MGAPYGPIHGPIWAHTWVPHMIDGRLTDSAVLKGLDGDVCIHHTPKASCVCWCFSGASAAKAINRPPKVSVNQEGLNRGSKRYIQTEPFLRKRFCSICNDRANQSSEFRVLRFLCTSLKT